jgi:hypothetical protein
MDDWRIERLGWSHERGEFRCGKGPLDDFLRTLVTGPWEDLLRAIRMKRLLLPIMIVAALAITSRGAEFPPVVEAAYARYKAELLGTYTDHHGLIVGRAGDRPAGIGDSAWRTGLAAFCSAVERDHAHTARLLRALQEKCWKDGLPIRHPDRTGPVDKYGRYSRDQFIAQMAACYYSWRFGNDEVQGLAKDLMERFVKALLDHDWQLNTGPEATLTGPSRFVVREVATAMGLGDYWKVDGIQRQREQRLLYDGYREAFIAKIKLQAERVKAGIRDGKPDPDDPMDYYTLHILFWEILLVYECRQKTPNLVNHTQQLYEACTRHRTAPYYWITGHETEPREWLAAWPPEWNDVDYVWQRNRKTQQEAAAHPSDEKYPRLDYMVLRRLFDLRTVH